MFTDTTWIYTSIAGAIVGAAALAYFKDTRMGLWAYDALDSALDSLISRWGFTWFEQPAAAWRKRYPTICAKIDELEARIADLEDKR